MSRVALIWTIIGVVVLVAFGWVFVMLPARAEREWQAVRAELEAKGEKLSLEEFPPPKIRDEDNFFADAIWWELSDRELVKTETGWEHRSRIKLEKQQLSALRKPMNLIELAKLEADFPELAPLSRSNVGLFDTRRIRNAALKDPALARRAAEFILRAQKGGEPVIARLRELSLRKDAYFPVEYGDGWSTSLQHCSSLRQAGLWLDFRVYALLEVGDYRDAFQDVVLIFRLGETLRRDTLIIPFREEIQLTGFFVSGINQGIRKHAWTAEELETFSRMLETVNAPGRLAATLRTERAFRLSVVWPSLTGKQFVSDWSEIQPVPAGPASAFLLYKIFSKPGDMAFFSNLIQQDLEALDAAAEKGMNAKQFPNRLAGYFATHGGASERYSKMVTVVWYARLLTAHVETARLQTRVDLARVAIALELYRMKHGEYPETLDAISSFFPKGMPLDIATMSPLRYRRKEDGSFLLWSVGWDGRDENGRTEKRPNAGDWVWGD